MNTCCLRKALPVFLVLGSSLSAWSAPPVVSNLTAAQRPGTKLVDISYDVTADTPTVAVFLEVSVDGGVTFSVPVTAASGDIGSAYGTGVLSFVIKMLVKEPVSFALAGPRLETTLIKLRP